MKLVELKEYITQEGKSPFNLWFETVSTPADAKIIRALTKLELGNFSITKSVGAGVFEVKIDFGPGYRVYFGKDGDTLVILLGGGTKKRQSNDIEQAKELWKDYMRRKKKGK